MALFAHSQRLQPRITHHGCAEYPAGATFGPRRLVDFEFVWIISGNVVWQCDGREYPAKPGTVLLARPGMNDGFRWDPLWRTRHGFFHFTVNTEGVELPPQSQWPMTLELPEGDVLRPLFHHLDWLLWSRPAGAEELIPGVMRQALLAYIGGTVATVGEPGQGPTYHPAIERVMAHVREVWGDGSLRPLSLAGLSRIAGISRAHLARLFLRDLGATPVETFRIMRLDHGALLLWRTNLKIQAVAEQCGFVNAFHFSRLFHGQYGVSPRTFRKELAAGKHMPTISLARIRDLSNHIWKNIGG